MELMPTVVLSKQQGEEIEHVVLNTCHAKRFNKKFILIKDQFAYKVEFNSRVPKDAIEISLNTKMALFQMNPCQKVKVKEFEPKGGNQLGEISIVIALLQRGNNSIQVNAEELENELKKKELVVNDKTYMHFSLKGLNLELKIFLQDNIPYGLIVQETVINFKKEQCQIFQLIDDGKDTLRLFEMNYESKVKNLRVGGHHQQLQLIDRRVFATRMINSRVMRHLGLKHIKGMLLHGPPGTGKTLIAREISKILKIEPKIVNGPEIISEMVGRSEQHIRELFVDAERDQNEKGLKSELHCIIFDEIDAICKKRGTHSSSAVYDLIVNQLLTCIDGINQLNNILVIGITNRKDLLDEAVLRPGRLEVHIQINIPDEAGRLQILNIHTQLMKSNEYLDDSVDLKEIARKTKNYTGAELEGVVKSAQSFALQRWKLNPEQKQRKQFCKVIQEDFERGVIEVPPQFGKDCKMLEVMVPKNKIKIDKYQQIFQHISQAIQNLGNGKHAFLLRGETGVGKTVLAAECALKANFPFTKVISADRFLGLDEGQVMNEVVGIFEDAEKCSKSLIILDDLLRLIEFVSLGPRYNASLFNLFINCIKKSLDPSQKQVILATAGLQKEFSELGFPKYFKYSYTMEELKGAQIHHVLKESGFAEASVRTINEKISKASISSLLNSTTIQGTENLDQWLRCFQQSLVNQFG